MSRRDGQVQALGEVSLTVAGNEAMAVVGC